MKRIYIFILLLLSLLVINAQDNTILNAFNKSFEKCTEKKGKERFKGQIIKGKRSGMGYYLFKNGSIYAGDFYKNEISGNGILISSGEVENCPHSKVYVGNWQKGKKDGFGRCYDVYGNLLYQGQFNNDKPTEAYPLNISSDKKISFKWLEEGYYFLGEINENGANGYGLIIFNNGDLWQSSFLNGKQKGIGLYLSYDGDWETINCVDDNRVVVSSSTEYENQSKIAKSNFKQALSAALDNFLSASQKGVELAGSISNNNNAGIQSSEIDVSTSGNSNMNGKPKSSKNVKVTCSLCKGTGVCRFCGGSGRSTTSKDGYCSGCHHNGKCNNCKGKGVV